MKKNFFLYRIFFLFIIVVINGCNKTTGISYLTSFDVSPDGKFIVYSFTNDEHEADLYKAKIDGTNAHLLIREKNYSFFNPKFSADGTKIFFIGNNQKKKESSIWEINEQTDTTKKIFEDVAFITEVISSKYDNILFYIKANDYDSYSPIAPKAKHDFDIYSLKIDSLKSKKISSLNSYGLYDLGEVDENRLILSQRGTENGIFFYDKKSTKKTEKIVTINDKLRNSTGYSKPVILKDGNIICASYFQLVKINLITKLEKTILPTSGYHFRSICYNEKSDRIFFTKRDDTNNIYSVNSNGENLTEVTLSKEIKP